MAPKDGTWEAHYEWTLDSVVLAGEVVLPDDKLGVGDPAWSFEGLSLELRIAPGQYPVYIAIACAVLEDAQVRRNCAVAELGSLVRAIAIVPVRFFRPLSASFLIGARVGFCCISNE